MAEEDGSAGEAHSGGGAGRAVTRPRARYEQAVEASRVAFERDCRGVDAGAEAVAARAAATDRLVRDLWDEVRRDEPAVGTGLAVLALGGYGRRELFFHSDVDLLFLHDGKMPERTLKEAIRRLNQALWDAGLRVSPVTRTPGECERFDAENVEFTLALLDARAVAGDPELSSRLLEKTIGKLVVRDRKKITARLLQIARVRHAKYGDTLFHLEPNLKECPGGLRDVHVCFWLSRLSEAETTAPSVEFQQAREFLLLVRSFLHLTHRRDDNTLDWQAQDQAAAAGLGLENGLGQGPGTSGAAVGAAYWMRFYFRHARTIERRLMQAMDEATPPKPRLLGLVSAARETVHAGFEVRAGRIELRAAEGEKDPAGNSDVALAAFDLIARTGARLTPESEARLEGALPLLAAHLEDGPGLWQRLKGILLGAHAGLALRGMHALGLLELLMPEFHGIDALVIRDAYHRYTVDEHTFVVIDTLHGLAVAKPAGAVSQGMQAWAARFGSMLRELPHPELLYLAALLHDTGKAHAAASGHARESARLAEGVLKRLELDPYEAGLVLDMIRNHLEMSAALRRDVFDAETIRGFATRVQAPEALRMLALFTYADIAAVHPDALTPWKAENLWRLHAATATFLDRHVDDERVMPLAEDGSGEAVHRVHALLTGRQAEVTRFLEGFPRRYLQTRTPEAIRDHFLMAVRCAMGAGDQLQFRYAADMSELTLVTRDRPGLFASIAGGLAAWGMNIVTADAFSNAAGLVVDSFRFTDVFRTLELNVSERERFRVSMDEVLRGGAKLDTLLASRRRGRKARPKIAVETRVAFDDSASANSTLLEVSAQDTPGLLRALSLPLAEQGCNIEVALVDTEGERAIDVFYVTKGGLKLDPGLQVELRETLLAAVELNAR